jgi:hypothetical protein
MSSWRGSYRHNGTRKSLLQGHCVRTIPVVDSGHPVQLDEVCRSPALTTTVKERHELETLRWSLSEVQPDGKASSQAISAEKQEYPVSAIYGFRRGCHILDYTFGREPVDLRTFQICGRAARPLGCGGWRCVLCSSHKMLCACKRYAESDQDSRYSGQPSSG